MIILADYKANYNSLNNLIRNPKPFFILCLFRLSSYFASKERNIVIRIIGIPVRILYRLLIEWIMGIEIPDTTTIGPGLRLHHCVGTVINPSTKIGKNLTIKNGTTIGAKVTLDDKFIAAPIIGDNVIIHSNSVIFGAIEIGDNAIIGAGSVVNKSVPSNSIVAGNPAKIIRNRNSNTDSIIEH